MPITVGARAKPLTIIVAMVLVLFALLYIGIAQHRERSLPPQAPPLRQNR